MLTTEKKANIELLKKYNEWRRGGDGEMLEPKEIGVAIDFALNICAKYDALMEKLEPLIEARDKAHHKEWILGGCSGRSITDPNGYCGDGFLADFDTKANGLFACKAANTMQKIKELIHE